MKAKIRTAKFDDLPAIVGLMEDGHRRSVYAEKFGFSEKRARSLIMQSIQRNGGSHEGSTYVAVADSGQGTEGFIIGVLQPLYLVLTTLEATDLFWYTREGANPSSAYGLLTAMHRWASRSPYVGVIRHGNSDAIVGKERTGALFTRIGMKQVGNIYEKAVKR